jgi:hypothetical protein
LGKEMQIRNCAQGANCAGDVRGSTLVSSSIRQNC